ncbi:hypothetical protein MUGA111182_16905 [Mucilaginibacter galii]
MYRDPEFFKELSKLVKKILPLIQPVVKNSFLPDSFKEYPNLTIGNSGFPSISNYPSIIDISKFFRPGYNGQKPQIDLTDYSFDIPGMLTT